VLPSLPISVGRRGGLVNNSRRDEPDASPSVTLHKARRYHSTTTTLRRYVDCLSISQIKEYQTNGSSLLAGQRNYRSFAYTGYLQSRVADR